MWLRRRRGRADDYDFDYGYGYDFDYGYELSDRAHADGWQLMADGYDHDYDYVNSFRYVHVHVDDCCLLSVVCWRYYRMKSVL